MAQQMEGFMRIFVNGVLYLHFFKDFCMFFVSF